LGRQRELIALRQKSQLGGRPIIEASIEIGPRAV
jgi:hypothetical protein